ncbi:MAG: discoidin domain-containing protein, partial [Candidatus Symbiothrix sp.]|nr:discoidin domain-containing protein [Candidatus Symbiothrix sp.]
MKTRPLFLSMIGLSLLAGCSSKSDSYTRGIGIYPGNPNETYAPEVVADNATYRNVAELKSAYQSSSYDYNLTAQLVTDGILSAVEPATINVSTQNGNLKKNEREWLFDGKSDSKYVVNGTDVYLQLDLNNFDFSVDKIVLTGSVTLDATKTKGYEVVAYGSNDGTNWDILGQENGRGYIGKERPASPWDAFFGKSANITRLLNQEIILKQAVNYAHYKINLKAANALNWSFTDWDYYKNDELLVVLPSYRFGSAWKSAGTGEEWVYVDLGASATFDKVKLSWINKALAGTIQTSDDAKTWKEVALLPGGSEKTDEIALFAKGRYVRVWMTEAENNLPYILSELEVYGKGGLVARPHAEPKADGNHQYLSGGNWKLQRASEVNASGEEISKPDFVIDKWLIATVPGTVLSSYVNIGALPDPNYADNILTISESFFYSNFWYRNEFTLPADFSDDTIFLNFDGVNWKANVFLNGQKVGNVNGGFKRGKFNISDLLTTGKNVLAIEIVKNLHQGAVKEPTAFSHDQNGGIPGADNPTFHATIGWDWIPTIRGRDIGIWNDVFLTHTGSVTIENPFVRTELPLPDTTSAKVFVEVTLVNTSNKEVSGTLKGSFGDAEFEQTVTLASAETKVVNLDPVTNPTLALQNPKLWWPKGYGEPYLYDVKLSFETHGKISDTTQFKSGVRQMTFDEAVYEPSGLQTPFGFSEPRRLSLYVNGRRFIGFGG